MTIWFSCVIEGSDIEIARLKQNNYHLNSSYNSAKSEIISLNEKIINIEKKNVHLEAIIKSKNIISDDTVKLNLEEMKTKLYADVMKMNIVQNVDTPIEKIINIISDNDDEKRRKENNIIIFGLQIVHPVDTITKSMELLNMMGISNINPKKCTRLVKRDKVDVYAPVKIELLNINEKFEILKAAKILKSINLKLKSNISICQDLTEFERNRHKLLLTERKKLNDELKLKDNYSEIGFYYGIRRNAVIKIDKLINQ